MSAPEFEIDKSVLLNGTVLEASAGTGKTYSVASVVVKELAVDDGLRIGGILITTFTRNAAAELTDRVRRRLVTVERLLRSDRAPDDALAQELHSVDRTARADRLARALREFDNATITTIHSVCSRILAMAGEVSVGHGEGADPRRIVAEVVNDAVVESAATGLVLDTKRLTAVVGEYLRSPKAALHRITFTGGDEESDRKNRDLGSVETVVRECVAEVHRRTRLAPTFDDMLRRAERAVSDAGRPAVVAALRQRYSLAVIDEAQDTDHLQWSIFRHIFDGRHSGGRLVAVGDPKQAIYRFRGADVEAYLDARDEDNMFTLSRNWRSDSDLIRVLNTVFAGKTFGESITYKNVSPRPGAPASAIEGDGALTLVDLGTKTVAEAVVEPAALRVREILETIRVPAGDTHRAVRPGEICVLVRANDRGSAIESRLRDMGVSAVSSGTENVMAGDTARAFVSLLQAMDNPYDTSLVRIAAATPFFGRSLADAGSLTEADVEAIQSQIVEWNKTLRRRGVAALATRIRSVPEVSARIVGGADGERNETDYSHVVELLHAETGGSGCTAAQALECAAELSTREATADTVSRRVESDKDAVQIMTVHAAKGLEFPVVVVADLWKRTGVGGSVPVVYLEGATPGAPRVRTIDVGHVLKLKDDSFDNQIKSAAAAEVDRLFYVAMTRARHHVSLLVSAQGKRKESAGRSTDGIIDLFTKAVSPDAAVRVLRESDITKHGRYSVKGRNPKKMAVAGVSRPIIQTYDRLSFSSITKGADGGGYAAARVDDRSGAGHNDDDQIISIRSGYADESVKPGADEMPLARLMGGTYFGKVMHKVYEKVDFAAQPLHAEVARVVEQVVTGSVLRQEHPALVRGVELSLQTPLGGALGEAKLADLTAADRLSELNFEMTLADWSRRSRVADIGRVLESSLLAAGRPEDPLIEYAREISSRGFNTDLMGLMNGSIDALVRLGSGSPRGLWVVDYKSNRLDRDGDPTLIEGYRLDSMLAEMFHHHYPLQALIYGTAVNRYLRSRPGASGPPHVVRGFAYLFIRGMVGPNTPYDTHGNRNGVVTWVAPDGLWESLSDVMMGDRR